MSNAMSKRFENVELRKKYSTMCKGENNPFFGKHHSEETKEKLRKPKTEEHKRKLSIAEKGKIISDESRRKMSASGKGRQFTEEHKKKISLANKGREGPHKGIPRTDEVKKKISDGQKRRWDRQKTKEDNE
jgi:hypothetical protein